MSMMSADGVDLSQHTGPVYVPYPRTQDSSEYGVRRFSRHSWVIHDGTVFFHDDTWTHHCDECYTSLEGAQDAAARLNTMNRGN